MLFYDYNIIKLILNQMNINFPWIQLNFEIKYCIKSINFANVLSRRFDYENNVNDEIYLFML